MGRIMHLPGGVKFDPETGEFRGGNIGEPPIALNRASRPVQNIGTYNVWQRFNFWVGSIGDWFAEHGETITSYCALILFILAWLIFAIGVISVWIDDGFWTALIGGAIVGVIFYYVSMITIGIFIWLSNLALAIVRYIFYSAYTLFAVLILMGILGAISLGMIPVN